MAFRMSLCIACGMLFAAAAGCGETAGEDAALTDPHRSAGAEAATTENAATGAGTKQTAEATTEAAGSPAASRPEIERLLVEAETAVEAGRLALAVELLSQCIALDPQNAAAAFQRGRAYADMGQNASALADLSTALQLNPKNASWWNTRGFFLLTRGSHEAAFADLNEAIALQPEFAEAYNNRGMVQMALGRAEEAVEDFAQALKCRPGYLDALNNRGFVRMRLGQFDEAIADFDAAIAIDSSAVNPLNNRGLTHFRQENYNAAVADFTEAIVRRPENPKYYRHRQSAWEQLGHTREADADRQKATLLELLVVFDQRIRENKGDAEAFLGRGEVRQRLGQQDLALNDFEQAASLNPRLGEAWLGQARVQLERGEFQQTVTLCDRALEANAGLAAWSIRGDAWYGLKDYGRAVADFERARRIDPTVAEAWQKHASQLEADGDQQAAAAARQHSVALLTQTRSAEPSKPREFPDTAAAAETVTPAAAVPQGN